MKPVYQFRDGSHLAGNAQDVGERLDKLRAKHDGLTPEQVLKDARNIRSALHGYFEWDDSKAAEQHRLTQAGHLIRSVHVTFVEAEPPSPKEISVLTAPGAPQQTRAVRAFVNIERTDGSCVYESTERAMADEGLRKQVIARAHGELNSVARKYRELTELAQVFQALDQVGEQLRESTAA